MPMLKFDIFFKEAECEKARMDARYEADTNIANSSRGFQMQKATFDIEVNAKVSWLIQSIS